MMSESFLFIGRLWSLFFVILGFGVPVALIGGLVLGATLPEYEGIERWLPDIEDRSVYELKSLQKIIVELDLSEDTHESAEKNVRES